MCSRDRKGHGAIVVDSTEKANVIFLRHEYFFFTLFFLLDSLRCVHSDILGRATFQRR